MRTEDHPISLANPIMPRRKHTIIHELPDGEKYLNTLSIGEGVMFSILEGSFLCQTIFLNLCQMCGQTL